MCTWGVFVSLESKTTINVVEYILIIIIIINTFKYSDHYFWATNLSPFVSSTRYLNILWDSMPPIPLGASTIGKQNQWYKM